MAAKSSGPEDKYLYDVPYSLTRDIIQSLDIDKGWEKLAGEAGYSFDRIKIFELEIHRYEGSPTRALLSDLGSRNTTLRELYLKFQNIGRLREMKIIENYIKNTKEIKIPNLEKEEKSLFSTTSRENFPQDMKITGLPGPPLPKRSNDVNFNNPKPQPAKIYTQTADGQKQLHDKVIPGFQPNDSISDKKREPQEDSEQPPSNSSSSSSDKAGSFSDNMSSGKPVNSFETSTSTSSYQGNIQSLTSAPDSGNLKAVSSMKPLTADNKNVNVVTVGTPVFSFRELSEATNNFDDTWKLGEGAFGKVYFGVLRNTRCAIKRLQEDITTNVYAEKHQQMTAELGALLRYRHENIVTLYGYALDGPSLCLVYQYMVNGSLEDRLQCTKNSQPLNWEKRISIALGAAVGLQYFHTIGEKPLIHGDIKSANILLDRHFEAKIGDLGQAQHATGGSLTGQFTHITKKGMNSKIYGTKAYFAPEVMRGSQMSVKSDVYAFGVVLLEICSGEKAYDERREPHKFIASHFVEVTDTCPKETWLNVFQDKKAGQCEDVVILKMLQCALSCVSERKKDRPDMPTVVCNLEQIEKRWRNNSGENCISDSFLNTVQCNPLSHESGPASGEPNLASNPIQPKSQMFTEKERPFVTIPKTGKTADSCSPEDDNRESIKLQKMYDKKQTKDVSSPVHSPQISSPILGSLNISLPPGTPIPDPLKLQLKIDMKQEGHDSREIARKITEFEQENINSYISTDKDMCASDPKKMAQIEEADAVLRKQNSEMETSVKCDDIFVAPKSDPAKLEALNMFDANIKLTKSSSSDDHTSDSTKLKDIEEFDKQNITDRISVDEDKADNIPLSLDDFPSYKLFESPKSLPESSANEVVYRCSESEIVSNPMIRQSEGFSITQAEESIKSLNIEEEKHKNENVSECVQEQNMKKFFEEYEKETGLCNIDDEEQEDVENDDGDDDNDIEENNEGTEEQSEQHDSEESNSCVLQYFCESSLSTLTLKAAEN